MTTAALSATMDMFYLIVVKTLAVCPSVSEKVRVAVSKARAAVASIMPEEKRLGPVWRPCMFVIRLNGAGNQPESR